MHDPVLYRSFQSLEIVLETFRCNARSRYLNGSLWSSDIALARWHFRSIR